MSILSWLVEPLRGLAADGAKTKFLDAHTFGGSNHRHDPRNLYRHKAEVQRQLGDYVGALESVQLFKELYSTVQSSLGLAYGFQAESHAFRMIGDFEAAKFAASAALEIFQERKNLRGICSTQRALGQALSACGDSARAISVFERLIVSSKDIYPYGGIYSELGIGEALFQIGRFRRIGQTFFNSTLYRRKSKLEDRTIILPSCTIEIIWRTGIAS